jgi:hypothetical protein
MAQRRSGVVILLVGEAGESKGRINCHAPYHSLGWGATLQDLKWLADGLLLNGINCFVPHAFFFSTHGLRKHDAPPSMFFQMPYWKFFGQLVRHTETVLKAFEGTHIAARVLVIDPTPGVPTTQQNTAFVRIQNLLLARHVDYLLVDLDTLRSGSIETGKLHLKDLTIGLVIVPPMLHIEPALASWLEQFQNAGGSVSFDDETFIRKLPPPSLRIAGDNGSVHLVTRKDANRTVWFLQNTSSAELQITVEDQPYRMSPYESLLITPEKLEPSTQPLRLKMPADFSVVPLNPNLLPVRQWSMALLDSDGSAQVHPVEPAPIIHQLERGKFRFSPSIDRAFGSIAQLKLPPVHVKYTACFQSQFNGPVHLIIEPGSIVGDWSMHLNQSGPLVFSPTPALIPGSLGVDVTNLLLAGENVIDIDLKTDHVDGGLLNCIYLAGDFGVILNPLGLVDPVSKGNLGDWEKNRLPFFAGVVEYRSVAVISSVAEVIEVDFDPLSLGDDACEICFNGGSWHSLPWSPRRVRPNPGELHVGQNDIRLRAYTTLLRAFEGERFDLPTHRTLAIR